MTRQLTVFPAKKVITMDPGSPVASAVLVDGDRIVEVGDVASMAPWLEAYPHKVDDRFANDILMPGLIDPHLHPFLGATLLSDGIVAPEDWELPNGTVPGCTDRESLLSRVKELAEDLPHGEPLLLWGAHTAWHGRITAQDLDAVCRDRPVILRDRSFHVLILNRTAIEWLDLRRPAPSEAESQIDWDAGIFSENGMFYALKTLMDFLARPERLARGLKLVSELVHRGGVTTCADLASGIFVGPDAEWKNMLGTLDSPETPFRTYLVPVPHLWARHYGESLEETFKRIESLGSIKTPHLEWLRAIKTFGDGAFVTQNMQLSDPGFIDCHHGEWMIDPDELLNISEPYWKAGYDIYHHVTGDLGVDRCLDTLQRLREKHPRFDFRYDLQHLGISRENQSARMARLGASASANGYYLNQLGDKYAQIGLGAERANNMVRLGSLARHDVPFSLHSDLPMGPVKPLLAVTTATTRQTNSGTVRGIGQAVTVDQALRAVTIDAAWMLRKDHEIGSLVAGKKADFTILTEDPFEVEAAHIKDIPILATVFEGTVFEIN